LSPASFILNTLATEAMSDRLGGFCFGRNIDD
jgi:hypothetical protein